jgi:hypothetical protein
MGSASAFPFSMMKIMRQSTEQWWVAEGETMQSAVEGSGGSNVTRKTGNMTIPKADWQLKGLVRSGERYDVSVIS